MILAGVVALALASWLAAAVIVGGALGRAVRLADRLSPHRQELRTVTVSTDRWTCPDCGGTVHTDDLRAPLARAVLERAQRQPCPHGRAPEAPAPCRSQVSRTGHPDTEGRLA